MIRYLSLAEIKAKYANQNGCPKCGCLATKVISTWDTATGRRRQRACLHCGTLIGTIEITLPEKGSGQPDQ